MEFDYENTLFYQVLTDCIDNFRASDWETCSIDDTEETSKGWEFMYGVEDKPVEAPKETVEKPKEPVRVADLPFALDFTDAKSILLAYDQAPLDPVWAKVLPYFYASNAV